MFKKQRTCPICKKKSNQNDYPFCSKKCADIDLSLWFHEDYRISVPPQTEEEIEELKNSIKETLD